MSLVKRVIYKVNDNLRIDITNLELLDGKITGLLGPSGCGKTTLMNILLGLIEGAILSWELNGQEMGELPVAERRLGVVFQNYDLFPMLTALENIEFAAKARKIPEVQYKENIEIFSEKLKITDILDRKADKLSGGEKQRVALARALVGNPSFLFLDEAFSSLDAGLRQESRELVREVISGLGISCLMITHDIDDVKSLASKVYEMREGKVIDSNLKIS
ncbi:ATP-binding cassette domain-containing protein [bacterium]|nr:ATP-binding cassette domain-containing protein [bacterium]